MCRAEISAVPVRPLSGPEGCIPCDSQSATTDGTGSAAIAERAHERHRIPAEGRGRARSAPRAPVHGHADVPGGGDTVLPDGCATMRSRTESWRASRLELLSVQQLPDPRADLNARP